MIAILEKYDLNTDFHQIVDFIEASHLRYALTFNPTVYVSCIRQFWSTARIETKEEGTKILATVDGEGSGTPTEPHPTPSPKAQQTSPTTHLSPSFLPVTTEPLPTVIPSDTPQLRQYTRQARIAQSLAFPPIADEHASLIRDDSQSEACPTNFGLEAEQDRENITKTSTLPSDSTPRVTSLAADEGSMQQRLNEMTALCTSLQRQQSKMASKIADQDLEISQLKARVNGDSVSISPVTEVYVAEVPTGSGSIPTASPPGTGVPTGGVPTGSDVVPTSTLIFTTATVATTYIRRKGKEKMVEFETLKKKKIQEQMDVQMARQLEEEMKRDAQRMKEQIARDAEITKIHAEEELQIMIDGLDRSNETVAKYLQEYYQFVAELPIGERIELISNLVKYQDNYAKSAQIPDSAKKTSLKEATERFLYVSIEESCRFKILSLLVVKKKVKDLRKKGIRLEQDSAKNVKTSEEVSEEKLKEMMELIPLWALVKETLNIRQAANDKEKELWVELKRLYEPDVEDQL
nr:hypothetical protein [Tanacetum cinerariifolium]